MYIPSASEAAPTDPYAALGLRPGATEQEIRAAYLARVKECPPDRAPSEFETIRDAYHLLRDPRRRAASLLMIVSELPDMPLASLADVLAGDRCFVGPRPWLAVLAGEEP
jgi:DnaJ-domain-containing protein 1